MNILNRRNALIGWLVWNVATRILAQKARQAVPAVDRKSKRPNRAAVIAVLATLGLGAWLARHYLEDDADEESGDA
jgi:hypothetical protein